MKKLLVILTVISMIILSGCSVLNDGNVIATYVLTDDVESIFPLSTDVFLNLSDYEIGNSYINFFLFEEMNLVDWLYDYNEFIQYSLNNGAEKFGDNHIIVIRIKMKYLI